MSRLLGQALHKLQHKWGHDATCLHMLFTTTAFVPCHSGCQDLRAAQPLSSLPPFLHHLLLSLPLLAPPLRLSAALSLHGLPAAAALTSTGTT